ncbi:hypothetical protein PIB30_060822 [Stylosanthes scabra]|uniref:Uncharacterized protein n=1 Tax=Stylosanthes scabra TaxID=79078 RepID=A0ABU6RKT1_9FABA|nr:hypothetical protein [Stylosanthes scabra]
MGDLDFTIDIYHGGKFHDVGDGLQYLGGSVLNDLHFEIDEWSLQEIVSLRALMSDGDAMKMGRLLVSQPIKHCSVYVVDGCKEGNGVEITSNNEDYIPSKEDYIGSGDGLVEVEVEGESAPSSEEDMFDDSVDDGEHEDYFGFDVEDDNEGATSNAFGGFNGPLNGQHNEQGDGGEAGGGDVSGVDADSDGGNSGDEISDGYETGEINSYEGDSDDMVKKKRYPKYNEAEMKDKAIKNGLHHLNFH